MLIINMIARPDHITEQIDSLLSLCYILIALPHSSAQDTANWQRFATCLIAIIASSGHNWSFQYSNSEAAASVTQLV